jgi:hypothetical protein
MSFSCLQLFQLVTYPDSQVNGVLQC